MKRTTNPDCGRSAPKPAGRYRHGALRESLLAAAEEILRNQGMEKFTLRECARRAGVSHAAPAHHFRDVQGLLTELAAIGFERMLTRMDQYRKEAPDEPTEQLRAVGQAYVDFAIANRALFQLMFRGDRLDRANERLHRVGMATLAHLESTLTGLAGKRPDDFLAEVLLAWSAMHGFATLLLESRLDKFRTPENGDDFARDTSERMLRLLVSLLDESHRNGQHRPEAC